MLVNCRERLLNIYNLMKTVKIQDVKFKHVML